MTWVGGGTLLPEEVDGQEQQEQQEQQGQQQPGQQRLGAWGLRLWGEGAARQNPDSDEDSPEGGGAVPTPDRALQVTASPQPSSQTQGLALQFAKLPPISQTRTTIYK